MGWFPASHTLCFPLSQQLLRHGSLPRRTAVCAASLYSVVNLHSTSHPLPLCLYQPAPRAICDNLSIRKTGCALVGYVTVTGVRLRCGPVSVARAHMPLAWRLLTLGKQTAAVSGRPCDGGIRRRPVLWTLVRLRRIVSSCWPSSSNSCNAFLTWKTL